MVGVDLDRSRAVLPVVRTQKLLLQPFAWRQYVPGCGPRSKALRHVPHLDDRHALRPALHGPEHLQYGRFRLWGVIEASAKLRMLTDAEPCGPRTAKKSFVTAVAIF